METAMPMLPSLARLQPDVDPFLPLAGVPADSLPPVRPRQVLRLSDGDSITLRATPVRKEIRGRTFKMWGYNGQIPGPLLEVPQGAEIVVAFRNEIELPSTIHWHGLRLDNRFDGVPGVTQEPVEPGERFVYRVRFPDAGIYWYHPHVREDVAQDLGLYGNLLVRPAREDAFGPVHREEVLTLDDLLVDDRGLFPWGRQASVHTLMGRFGNVFLVDGSNDWSTELRRGEVVRFYFTNVSNTRTFNLRLGEVPLKLVAADLGRFERETRVEHVAIAPAQRYVVEARFDEPGTVALTNRIQAIDHYRGEFYPRVDTLGLIHVAGEPVEEELDEAFRTLREHEDVQEEVAPYRSWVDRAPDRELVLTVEVHDLPLVIRRMMELDTLYSPPVEWNDAMPMMNYVATGRRMTWTLEDPASGATNMDIDWRFRVGQRIKLRLRNPEGSIHPMQHPMHLHGQRVLVLARDGVPNENLVWKDTAVVPVGSTVDLLVEFTNPGDWMLHCHISEHLESGMRTVFHVAPDEDAPPREADDP
jgi:FtsP/CotA-like multicopper oxidase with cupredoxin domain